MCLTWFVTGALHASNGGSKVVKVGLTFM